MKTRLFLIFFVMLIFIASCNKKSEQEILDEEVILLSMQELMPLDTITIKYQYEYTNVRYENYIIGEAIKFMNDGIDILLTLDTSNQAIQILEKAVELEPKLSIAYLYLSFYYLQVEHDSQKSKAIIIKGIEHCSGEPYLYFALANAHAFDEEYQQAIINYRKSLELLYFALADSNAFNEEYQQVIILELWNDNVSVSSLFYNLANCLTKVKENKKAIEIYKRAIKFYPNHFKAWKNLIIMYYIEGDKNNFVEYADKLWKLDYFGMYGVWAKYAISKKFIKYNIPSNISNEVRTAIVGLYSLNHEKQMESIFSLEAMGPKAVPAAPFLLDISGEQNFFIHMDSEGEVHLISTSNCVELALEAMGEGAIEHLIAALGNEDSKTRETSMLVLKTLTGNDYGQDPVKWHDWWQRNKD